VPYSSQRGYVVRQAEKKICRSHKNQAVNLQQNKIEVGMDFNIFLIVLCSTFFCRGSYAQQSSVSLTHKSSSLYILSFTHEPGRKTTPDLYGFSFSQNKDAPNREVFYPGTTPAKDRTVKNLAFFCRQEWKIEKTLKIPFQFRVGSLAQCNALEGK
jgi:hypothetical protein